MLEVDLAIPDTRNKVERWLPSILSVRLSLCPDLQQTIF